MGLYCFAWAIHGLPHLRDKIAIDLVNKRIDINHQDDKGFSSLHYCAQFSNINIAELLLKNNANINIVDSYGNNPLWTAVFNNTLLILT